MVSRIMLKRVALAGLLVLVSGGLFSLKPAFAQTASPTFLVTWKTTGSYVPAFYQGKMLPTYGSKITASLELVSPQGKLLDLSGQTIYWYVNDILAGGGVGVQQVTFPPLGDAPNTADLRVTLPNYDGAYIAHDVIIPMVLPEAVVYAPFPGGQFSQNPLAVEALPYFFNIADPTDLSYSWSVNGQSGSNAENPETADITIPQGAPSGTGVDVSLSISNSNDSTVATAGANLTYESQL